MHKDGKTTDNGRTRQKYCCPFRQSKTGVCPCNHKNWNNGKKNRGCTKYKTVPDDYRLSIDRSCLCFKRTYALRTECERYNSRFKSTGQERLWVRNGAQRGKPQYAGPHLCPDCCVGRRSARLSLLPFCQTASAFRLICLFHTFFRRGVYRAMVFAPLRRPKLF